MGRMEGECEMNEARDYLRKAGLTEGQIGNLEAMGYFRQPASKGHHLSGYGGLARHSTNVTRRLVQLTNCLCVRWPRPASPYVVGMLHDLVKLQCYRLKGEKEGRPEWEYVQPVYPTVTPTPTPLVQYITPKPQVQETGPKAGTRGTLAVGAGSGSTMINVYNESSLTSLKAAYPAGQSITILQYGASSCMILIGGEVVLKDGVILKDNCGKSVRT